MAKNDRISKLVDKAERGVATRREYRFAYEIALPESANTNECLERLQALIVEYGGTAGGGMIAAPNAKTRYRLVSWRQSEIDAPSLSERDVVTMTEGRKLLGIPSGSGMATFVRMHHAPIAIDLHEPNPQRANRLLLTWVKGKMAERGRRWPVRRKQIA